MKELESEGFYGGIGVERSVYGKFKGKEVGEG